MPGQTWKGMARGGRIAEIAAARTRRKPRTLRQPLLYVRLSSSVANRAFALKECRELRQLRNRVPFALSLHFLQLRPHLKLKFAIFLWLNESQPNKPAPPRHFLLVHSEIVQPGRCYCKSGDISHGDLTECQPAQHTARPDQGNLRIAISFHGLDARSLHTRWLAHAALRLDRLPGGLDGDDLNAEPCEADVVVFGRGQEPD
jgi:hypothetical protein